MKYWSIGNPINKQREPSNTTMTKHFVVAGLLAMATATTAAQTLFTYGTDSVSVQDFLTAYQKNNATANTEGAKREYLQLYIASRLKIKEARERGYETLPHMQAEIKNLREQILPAYLKDEEAVEKLTREAHARAQKDMELSHIFISLTGDGIANAAEAKIKADEAFAQLQAGKPFADVARRFSDDPSAKDNGGKVGYITAFTLPYELEGVAYATTTGQFSKPYLSKRGYHIFRNDGERKALGRMRIAQILLLFPPDADAATEAVLKKKADSIYARLLKGDDFAKLATQFSEDAVSAQAGGLLPEMGVGQYSADFEKVVYGLPKDGALSTPFKTAHGYHIVKRISHLPVTADEKGLQAIREKVESSEDRMATMQAALTQKIIKSGAYKKEAFQPAELWAYSDSVLDGKKGAKPFTLQEATTLFTIGETEATVEDWISFAQIARYKSDGTGIKPYAEEWEAFEQSVALEHYKENLEMYNAAFRQQLEEFKEGSLFFEIMQREIWNGAQVDTVALQDYYTRNKQKYVWQRSADAVLFYANDSATAKGLQTALAKKPKAWRATWEPYSQSVVADSARFELDQLPGTAKGAIKVGTVTQPTANADNSFAFAYVVKVYNSPAQRTFAEARNQVLADYQASLEKDWVESLKKKYEVKINEQLLNQVLSKADRSPL